MSMFQRQTLDLNVESGVHNSLTIVTRKSTQRFRFELESGDRNYLWGRKSNFQYLPRTQLLTMRFWGQFQGSNTTENNLHKWDPIRERK